MLITTSKVGVIPSFTDVETVSGRPVVSGKGMIHTQACWTPDPVFSPSPSAATHKEEDSWFGPRDSVCLPSRPAGLQPLSLSPSGLGHLKSSCPHGVRELRWAGRDRTVQRRATSMRVSSSHLEGKCWHVPVNWLTVFQVTHSLVKWNFAFEGCKSVVKQDYFVFVPECAVPSII